MRVARIRGRNTIPLRRSNESPARFRFVGCSSVPDAHVDLSRMQILRAIFQPRIYTDKEKDSGFRVQKSLKIRVETRSAPASVAATHRGFAFYVAHPIRSIHMWLSSSAFLIAPRKSPCRRAPASPPPQLRWRNLASFPSKAGQDRCETLLAAGRAARATGQNASGTLRLPPQVVGSSSNPRSTIEKTRAALPFPHEAFRA